MDERESVKDEDILRAVLESPQGPQLEKALEDTIRKFNQSSFDNSSFFIATETLNLLRRFVGGQKRKNPEDLISLLRAAGRRLILAKPTELVISNAVRRVLFLIREEQGNLKEKNVDLRPIVIDSITEVLQELENSGEPISKQAADLIHVSETIYVPFFSHTILNFTFYGISKVAKSIQTANLKIFTSSHQFAKELSEKLTRAKLNNPELVEIIVMNLNNLCVVMPRINKVLISPKILLADGGLISQSGTEMVLLAAKEYQAETLCIAGLHKLCPQYMNQLSKKFGLKLFQVYRDQQEKMIQRYEYCPTGKVDLYVTNSGGHHSSYLYRLISEYYHELDTEI
eukprot:maker-scaffold_1-snap-gene-28.30-mRNA-1 protein AED:0.01 eAED:0.01 QI:127/1/1/1/1/1/4/69/341